MYAQRRSGPPVPDNYSGNAFRYPPIGSLTQTEEPLVEPLVQAEQVAKEMLPVPLPHGERPGILGLGTEELLLLGLCLLLAFGEGEGRAGLLPGRQGDILPYLVLLLFCG